MKCHQRVIREEAAIEQPRPVPDSLEGFRVLQIPHYEAEPIIMKYEWLGTMASFPVATYGLMSPDNELHGVACFGRGMGTNAGKLTTAEGAKPICLERGACVHWSHPHAPSKLVAGACRQMHLDHGYNVFFAYSDREAGEVGTIYQACNWIYLGRSPGRASDYRWKYRHRETGEVLSSRSMRAKHAREGRGTLDLFDNDQWDRIKDWGKGKYVWFEGSKSEKKKLRKGLRYEQQPYPKRDAD
jgi:hypothetical protein